MLRRMWAALVPRSMMSSLVRTPAGSNRAETAEQEARYNASFLTNRPLPLWIHHSRHVDGVRIGEVRVGGSYSQDDATRLAYIFLNREPGDS